MDSGHSRLHCCCHMEHCEIFINVSCNIRDITPIKIFLSGICMYINSDMLEAHVDGVMLVQIDREIPILFVTCFFMTLIVILRKIFVICFSVF